MYEQWNGMNTNDLEWAWRSLCCYEWQNMSHGTSATAELLVAVCWQVAQPCQSSEDIMTEVLLLN